METRTRFGQRGTGWCFLILGILLIVLAPESAHPQAFEPYESRSEFLLTSPASTVNGLHGYLNPALASHIHGSETVFVWSDRRSPRRGSNQWGLFTGVPHLGFGMVHRRVPGRDLTDYNLAVASGDRSGSLGVAYGWSSGSAGGNDRQNRITLGSVLRPSRRVSLGITLVSTLDGAREAVADLALRPAFGRRLTLFAEAASANEDGGGGEYWSGGASLEVADGILLTGRFFDNRTVSLGLELGFSRTAVNMQSRLDGDRREFNTYSARVGPRRASALTRYRQRDPKYLELQFDAPTVHRRFPLFDRSQTLLGLLQVINRSRTDESIRGLALNLSGLRISFAMAWELREALREFKTSGKRVIVYIDQANLVGYHLASVADRVYMDPVGLLSLEGFVAGQTYFAGSLKKLGVGFDEWRFFKYKSAMEALSRRQMSAADREQWTVLIEDFYDTVRSEICAERRLQPSEFDRLVDETTVFLAADALASGLVDSLGRWDNLEELVGDLEGGKGAVARSYAPIQDTEWGARPRVAVVYALGVCAMDSGIRARTLVKELNSIAEDEKIDAVVLRVDSPGGDGLASDLVAAAVTRIRAKKPVIVSQGSVAASGGYWLSMNADVIVAAPNTATGSIGIIGGWLYNLEFKQKLGLTTDHVKVGAHADLRFGATLPVLGLTLPDRNLHDGEKETMERLMRSLYRDFVGKVAKGRGVSAEKVEESAQGRVWSGKRAVERGLVDELGGLNRAIRIAVEKAGVPPEAEVELVEYPRQPLLDPGIFSPRLVRSEASRFADFLRFRLDHNGRPLALMPDTFINSFAHEVPQAEPLGAFGRAEDTRR
jgi:protease-4